MALDRPFDDGHVQTANVAVSASTVSTNIIIDYLIVMLRAKRRVYPRHFGLDEAAETDVSDQRGRRKTAELHTSRAKGAETWAGGR